MSTHMDFEQSADVVQSLPRVFPFQGVARKRVRRDTCHSQRGDSSAATTIGAQRSIPQRLMRASPPDAFHRRFSKWTQWGVHPNARTDVDHRSWIPSETAVFCYRSVMPRKGLPKLMLSSRHLVPATNPGCTMQGLVDLERKSPSLSVYLSVSRQIETTVPWSFPSR